MSTSARIALATTVLAALAGGLMWKEGDLIDRTGTVLIASACGLIIGSIIAVVVRVLPRGTKN